jgi:predicted ATPase/class 3 adenylate cyclase
MEPLELSTGARRLDLRPGSFGTARGGSPAGRGRTRLRGRPDLAYFARRGHSKSPGGVPARQKAGTLLPSSSGDRQVDEDAFYPPAPRQKASGEAAAGWAWSAHAQHFDPMPELPRGTVTLLFTDIEGSTRLLNELGDAYAATLAEHRRVLREAFQRHGGVEVDTQGDAFFYAFPKAAEAAAAAEEAQRNLSSGHVRVRMGLHTGKPTVTEEGYVGIDVHRAARIMGAGHGGQVLVSQITRELLNSSFELRDLGEHRLKDLSKPEWLFQFGHEHFPPLKSLSNTNLPAQASSLIGRERELGELSPLLAREDVRLVTLTGPGGTGKTRLALRLAADLVESYRNGVFLVTLAPISDPALVISTIAQTLGVKEQPGEPLSEALASELADKQLLLVLDNFEQVVDAATEVGGLLAAAPQLRLLVTSREPLHLRGEHEYSVPPLSDSEALTLFAERAREVRMDFVLDGDRLLVEQICARLDRLPLAIELAAARIKVLPPKKLLERLEQHLPLLTSTRRDLPERQRTLQATIAWSYDLLTEEEQRLFARLSVFAGGCRLDGAEKVGDPEGTLELLVIDGLASLIDKSLLHQTEDPDGEPRYWMLETIREFAAERRSSDEDAEQIEDAFAQYVVSIAMEAARKTRGGEAQAWLARLDREQDNVRTALGWLLERERGDDIARVVAGMWFFWWQRGQTEEGVGWAERSLALEQTTPLLRAYALSGAGELLRMRGNFERAVPLKEEALGLYSRLERKAMVASTLHDLGEIAFAQGDLARARQLHEQSLAVREELGRPGGIAHALGGLADVDLEEGNYERARSISARIIEIGRAENDPECVIGGLTSLVDTARREGATAEALVLAREALAQAAQIGLSYYAYFFLDQIARMEGCRDDPLRAARLWGAADALRQTAGYLVWDPRGYDAAVEAARARADGADFDAAWTAGYALSGEEAIRYALLEGTP